MNIKLSTYFKKQSFTLLSFTLMILIVFSIIYSLTNNSINKVNVAKKLISSASTQIRYILPSFLLPEQAHGVDLILTQIQSKENLHRIALEKKLPKIFERCTSLVNSFACHGHFDSFISVAVPIRESNRIYGYLIKEKYVAAFFDSKDLSVLNIILILSFLGSVSSLIWMMSKITSKEIPQEVEHLLSYVESCLSDKDPQLELKGFKFQEFDELATSIQSMVTKNEDLRNEATFSQVAKQLAHDIRSPLTALEVVSSKADALSEPQRLLLRSACQRINDIANSLLKKSEGKFKANQSNRRVELIWAILDQIVSEKRACIPSSQSITIELVTGPQAYSFFSLVTTSEFKRLISNILNNSIDAITGTGKIRLRIRAKDNRVAIVITDTGKGMKKTELAKVGSEGVSYKSNGSGLGLYHAISCIKSWNGTFHIQSKLNFGTSVAIHLPLATRPQWFMQKLALQPGLPIVVLDDDNSIHEVWKTRLGSQFTNHFHHFYDIENFLAHAGNISNVQIYLIDYEIIGSAKNGIDAIEELNIQEKSVLVTSRFESERIKSRCLQLGIKIIPKSIAPMINIQIAKT